MAGNRRRGLCFAAAIILLGAGVAGFGVGSSGGDDAGAANPPTPTIVSGAPVVPEHFQGDLRALPHKGPPDRKKLEVPEEPLGGFRKPAPTEITPPTQLPTAAMPTPSTSFKGLDFNGWGAGWPPDTVGDVGPNHYIQAVNTSIGIFSKTGTQLAAFTFNTLWSAAGTGTACDTSNGGDPTVIYDPMGDRWIVADFAFTGNGTTAPYYECIAVSKTSDPVAAAGTSTPFAPTTQLIRGSRTTRRWGSGRTACT